MTSRFEQRISEAYGQHADKYVSVLEPALAPMAAEIAKLAGLTQGQSALDLATGTGLIARALARSSPAVVGADISLGILKRARRQGNGAIPFVSADAHRLPFKGPSFDLVTCGVSLSHFSDISTALAEIRRMLRPGGRFITSAWGNEGESPAKDAAIEVRRRFLPDREATFGGDFGEDLWADVARGRSALMEAGFADVQVSTVPLVGAYGNHTEAIEAALAWPVTRYRIAQMAPSLQRRLREETASAIRQVSDLRWRSEVHYYQATRPGG